MGLLDWLMFWKHDEPEMAADADSTEFEINGCFTVPDDACVDDHDGELVAGQENEPR